MSRFRVGDRVIVVAPQSFLYGDEGVVTEVEAFHARVDLGHIMNGDPMFPLFANDELELLPSILVPVFSSPQEALDWFDSEE